MNEKIAIASGALMSVLTERMYGDSAPENEPSG